MQLCLWLAHQQSGADQACVGLRMIIVTCQPDPEQSVTWVKLSDLACQESSLVDHSWRGSQPNSATQHTRVMHARQADAQHTLQAPRPCLVPDLTLEVGPLVSKAFEALT